MTPMPGETGAGHQPLGLKSWWQTCCAPLETRGPMRVCQSASKTCSAKSDQCPTPDFSSACILPTIHYPFTSLSEVVSHYPVLLWNITVQYITVKWEFSVRATQYTVDSEMSYTCTQSHAFQSFSGNNILSNLRSIFVVFNCHYGISITSHMGMLPQMQQETIYFLSFRDFRTSC